MHEERRVDDEWNKTIGDTTSVDGIVGRFHAIEQPVEASLLYKANVANQRLAEARWLWMPKRLAVASTDELSGIYDVGNRSG